jgi:hypothetical protein
MLMKTCGYKTHRVTGQLTAVLNCAKNALRGDIYCGEHRKVSDENMCLILNANKIAPSFVSLELLAQAVLEGRVKIDRGGLIVILPPKGEGE